MTATGYKYLLFTLHGRRYAVDLAQVAEIEEPPTLWPIPGVPACYPGAMNFHGSIVAVMDLAAFLGHPAATPPEKVIVLAPAIASLALLVERVEGIVPGEKARFSDEVRKPDKPYSSGTLTLADGSDAELFDVTELARVAAERMATV